MPRLSITLTDSQAEALDRIAAETGATKQSMIGLAVSAWIRENDREHAASAYRPAERLSGWYGWANVTELDPLSGEPHTASVGFDGPFATRDEAQRYADGIADANREDGTDATAYVIEKR